MLPNAETKAMDCRHHRDIRDQFISGADRRSDGRWTGEEHRAERGPRAVCRHGRRCAYSESEGRGCRIDWGGKPLFLLQYGEYARGYWILTGVNCLLFIFRFLSFAKVHPSSR